MTPRDLLQANLRLVERIVGRVSRRAGLQGADAEDFHSAVLLALIENDYAVIRKYEGRSSFGGFLSVVVEHRLLDWRIAERGKWSVSAEAQRLGPAAVALERLVARDGRPLEAALPLVQAIDPSMTLAAAEAVLARLPVRTMRPRPVGVEDVDPDLFASHERADERALAADETRTANEANRVVRGHLDALPEEDRALLRLRFAGGLSIADISRAMHVPQRPLYRKLETLLARLRVALRGARIDAGAVEDLLGAAGGMHLDFGLSNGKKSGGTPSLSQEPQ
jgi:RNA polymerase sigma factor (sigma-70 family)